LITGERPLGKGSGKKGTVKKDYLWGGGKGREDVSVRAASIFKGSDM